MADQIADLPFWKMADFRFLLIESYSERSDVAVQSGRSIPPGKWLF